MVSTDVISHLGKRGKLVFNVTRNGSIRTSVWAEMQNTATQDVDFTSISSQIVNFAEGRQFNS